MYFSGTLQTHILKLLQQLNLPARSPRQSVPYRAGIGPNINTRTPATILRPVAGIELFLCIQFIKILKMCSTVNNVGPCDVTSSKFSHFIYKFKKSYNIFGIGFVESGISCKGSTRAC